MSRSIAALAVLSLALVIGSPASGEDAPAAAVAPPVAVGGSDSVSIGGGAAQRVGDPTSQGGVQTDGSPDVFIDGRPAAVTGSSGCGGGVSVGSANVFINGKPAAIGGGGAAAPCK